MLDHPGSPCTFGRCSTARQLVCSEFLPGQKQPQLDIRALSLCLLCQEESLRDNLALSLCRL